MKNVIFNIFIVSILSGCFSREIRPIYSLNTFFVGSAFEYDAPSLVNNYLATLIKSNEKKRIELIDLNLRKAIFLPGVNVPNSYPISVSVSSKARRLAFIRSNQNDNQVFVLFRRSGKIRKINTRSDAEPFKVSISASGEKLAIQFLRNGKSFVQIIRLES